jgi:hypothetical protein
MQLSLMRALIRDYVELNFFVVPQDCLGEASFHSRIDSEVTRQVTTQFSEVSNVQLQVRGTFKTGYCHRPASRWMAFTRKLSPFLSVVQVFSPQDILVIKMSSLH